MSRRRRKVTAARIRRGVQVVFLLLFFGLLLLARPVSPIGHDAWFKLFFLFDPLILIATWLSAHAVPLLSLLSRADVLIVRPPQDPAVPEGADVQIMRLDF